MKQKEIKDTKDVILDKAEELFAKKGYKGTSLRMITSEAGVNLAAVNYHFGSKEGLVAAVISRRIVPLNEERDLRLEEVLGKAESDGIRPALSDVLMAFLEPTMRLPESAPGAKNFVTLIGRAMADTDETARRIFIEHMGPAIKKFHHGLSLALPELSEEALYWRLNFLIGAMSHTLRCIDKCLIPLASGEPKNAQQLVELIMPFMKGGMEAPT